MEKKLKNIESELHNLKSVIIKLSQNKEPKKLIKIRGLLKGIEFSEGDIHNAKNSVFVSGD